MYVYGFFLLQLHFLYVTLTNIPCPQSGYQPFLPSIPSQFFRNADKPSETTRRRQPIYRKRVGRGGRLFIDRRGFRPSSGETGGKYKPSVPMDMESDASDNEDYMVNDMDDR
jgi:enhancer of polycomb-like protein